MMPTNAKCNVNLTDTGLTSDDVTEAQVATCKASIKRAVDTLLSQANANNPSVVSELPEDGVDLSVNGVIISGLS